MRVKRYEAASMQEAVLKVKAEMGSDAVILYSKRLRRGGLWGLLKAQPWYEVIAAVDGESATGPAEAMGKVAENAVAVRIKPDGAKPASRVTRAAAEHDRDVASEIAAVRELLVSVASRLEEKGHLTAASDSISQLDDRLRDQEVSEECRSEIRRHVLSRLAGQDGQIADEVSVREAALEYLEEQLSAAQPAQSPETPTRRPHVIAVVGPTGVGKTTTLAKLAARYALVDKKSVGMVTADTYRIAAVEQLHTYADIMGVPLEVAFHPGQLSLALRKFQDRDVILLDTAGRSQRNQNQMEELVEFLESAEPAETLLVLSATTKPKDLVDCLYRFSVTKYTGLVFTKLDETTTFGVIHNAAHHTGLPVVYVTDGQNVPDDIEQGDPKRLAEMVLGAV